MLENVLLNIYVCIVNFFRLGYEKESLGYFWHAVAADRMFLKAQENADNVCSSLVERWHFRMLNDRVRNDAFRGAITHAVHSILDTSDHDLVILDIGTGSAILRYHIYDIPVTCIGYPLVSCCENM